MNVLTANCCWNLTSCLHSASPHTTTQDAKTEKVLISTAKISSAVSVKPLKVNTFMQFSYFIDQASHFFIYFLSQSRRLGIFKDSLLLIKDHTRTCGTLGKDCQQIFFQRVHTFHIFWNGCWRITNINSFAYEENLKHTLPWTSLNRSYSSLLSWFNQVLPQFKMLLSVWPTDR